MDKRLDIEMMGEGGVAVVTFKEASIVDEEGIAVTSVEIKGFIKENNPSGLVFDFGEVKFFSSRLLGLLLDVRSNLEAGNCEAVISGINPQLYRIFKITNLDKIFKFFPDKDTAIKTISSD